MVEEQLIMKDPTIIIKSLINSGHSALASATCLVVPAEILLHSPAACNVTGYSGLFCSPYTSICGR